MRRFALSLTAATAALALAAPAHAQVPWSVEGALTMATTRMAMAIATTPIRCC